MYLLVKIDLYEYNKLGFINFYPKESVPVPSFPHVSHLATSLDLLKILSGSRQTSRDERLKSLVLKKLPERM